MKQVIKLFVIAYTNYGSFSLNSTQNMHTTYITYLAKANASFRTILPRIKLFLHNSTHKHEMISRINAQLQRDMRNIKTTQSLLHVQCAVEFVKALTRTCMCTNTLYTVIHFTVIELY